jgi:hypothetical protein
VLQPSPRRVAGASAAATFFRDCLHMPSA